MKKDLLLLAIPALAVGVAACTSSNAEEGSPVKVHWEAINLPLDSTEVQTYEQTFTLTGNLVM